MVEKTVKRTETLCPGCFKGKLLHDERDGQVWCDRCGTEFEFVGEGTNVVQFK
jgi:ribosomal protein S27AE